MVQSTDRRYFAPSLKIRRHVRIEKVDRSYLESVNSIHQYCHKAFSSREKTVNTVRGKTMNTEQALTDLHATLDCLSDHLGDSTYSLEVSKAVTSVLVSIYEGLFDGRTDAILTLCKELNEGRLKNEAVTDENARANAEHVEPANQSISP